MLFALLIVFLSPFGGGDVRAAAARRLFLIMCVMLRRIKRRASVSPVCFCR
jgi:hypothetical protein